MFSIKEMPTASSLFQTYASMTGSVMLFRTLANDIIPYPFRVYITTLFRNYFKLKPSKLTLVIEDTSSFGRNQVYDAAEIYLSTKLSSDTERLRISKSPKEKNITIRLEQGEKVADIFDGVELKWRFFCSDHPEKNHDSRHPHFSPQTMDRMRFFELTFHKKNKDTVLNSYVPFVLERAKDIKNQQRILKMHTLNTSHGCGLKWDSVNLEHPSTFDTLAMDHEQKNALIDDLDRFVKRKEFYKRVGKAWKRGYLLYGPPGTGKSSLVAAIANYLKFDVYDLQLANIMRDSDLRRLLLTTGNRSVLVIEDIDCSVDLPDRRYGDGRKQSDLQMKLTLSGLLNFVDGLWSSCGDERIIVFTTNHKERLDPALLRPGRMDMHINMSYCTYHGFKLLASNYLGISENHRLFKEIEGLLDSAEVTPAQVAEELMKSEDADIALEGFVNLLKRKKIEGSELEDDNANEVGMLETKRRKIEKKPSRPVRITRKRKSTRKCRK